MDAQPETGKKAINKELYKYYNLHQIFNNLEFLKNVNPEDLKNIIDNLRKSVQEEENKNKDQKLEKGTPIIDLKTLQFGSSNLQNTHKEGQQTTPISNNSQDTNDTKLNTLVDIYDIQDKIKKLINDISNQMTQSDNLNSSTIKEYIMNNVLKETNFQIEQDFIDRIPQNKVSKQEQILMMLLYFLHNTEME
jgi:hypothetical protein